MVEMEKWELLYPNPFNQSSLTSLPKNLAPTVYCDGLVSQLLILELNLGIGVGDRLLPRRS